MVQFEFIFKPFERSAADRFLSVNGRDIPIRLVRNPRARRYIVRLGSDGSARVTIPRGGSVAEAQRFAQRNTRWFEEQLQRLATRPSRPKEWRIGTEILFRGETVKIQPEMNGERGMVRFGTEAIPVTDPTDDLRSTLGRHLWKLAARELPPRVLEFAAMHQLSVHRIAVRNQRSRWGSCSRRGTISLNWRLIQAPAFVQDYLILHELCHLRQMNHSRRFWREVERVCPDFQSAERWLKQHSALLQ